MVIQSISLKNFKAHKDSHFDFTQKTSFIGTSNAGKSDILRALRLVLLNQNWPERWIRRGCSLASITVRLSSGVEICRTRNRTTQSVSILKNGVTTPLAGKVDAGSYIEEATGIYKSLIASIYGEDSLNFIAQGDPVFLISKGTVLVQRRICGVFGLNKVEDAKSKLISNSKKLTADYETGNLRLSHLLPLFESLNESFESSNHLLNEAKDNEKLYQELVDKSNKLKDIRDRHQKVLLQLNTLGNRESIQKSIAAIKKLQARLLGIDSKSSILLRYKFLKEKLSASQLSNIQGLLIVIKSVASQFQKLIDSIARLNEVTKVRKAISELHLSECRDRIKVARDNLNQVLKEEGRCPVCLQTTETLYT